jgi:hypothetical protein
MQARDAATTLALGLLQTPNRGTKCHLVQKMQLR